MTVTSVAELAEEIRKVILAAAIIHDVNKLDKEKRNVKTLARDKAFLEEQLKLAGVIDFINNDEDWELVRKLSERHSGHNISDGMMFFPEDENIKCYTAMLIAADLFDLGISETERFKKVQNELTIAFKRPCNLLRIKVTENRGYITALLLSACEEVLKKHNLVHLAFFPDGILFEGGTLPSKDLTKKIAFVWQQKIDQVFSGNIEQLITPGTSGIKVDRKAIEQDLEESLECVQALLEKKKAKFQLKYFWDLKFYYVPIKFWNIFIKINCLFAVLLLRVSLQKDIMKYSYKAGINAVNKAKKLVLDLLNNAEEFAISEGLKAVYNSYRAAGIKTQKVWEIIGNIVGLSAEQIKALEPFDPLYGRCLFAAKTVNESGGMNIVISALRDSFDKRLENNLSNSTSEVSDEIILEVSKVLNLPSEISWQENNELENYINADSKQRCSLGATYGKVEKLKKPKMPLDTKVQMFSNRFPGGDDDEPVKRGNLIAALAYELIAVGSKLPTSKKHQPLYLHFSLPQGAAPELLRIWRDFLKRTAAVNGDGGTVTVDELKLYKDNILEFQANKAVGIALPKRPNFIYSVVTIPVIWGDVNYSVALLKSLRLALELSLSLERGFPFAVTGNLEINPESNYFGRVEGIPSSLQPLLGNGSYKRIGHLSVEERKKQVTAEEIRDRLRCIGNLAISVASLEKKDDCLYDLARAVKRPFDLYFVLYRWILREQDDPNWEYYWNKIKEPLTTLLNSLMPEQNELLTKYLKEAAQVAVEGKLWGSSFKRTAQVEPFSEFITAIRSRKSHMPWDVIFAALVQDYHTRLDRIREHGVGATKYGKVKQYYDVLRKLFAEVYLDRPEKILADKKTLEAAYLFFLQDVRQQAKSNSETESEEITTVN